MSHLSQPSTPNSISKAEDQYPTVGERLNIQHLTYQQISIETEIIEYQHLQLAVCRAKVQTSKGSYTGSGVASLEKDPDMITSLLEIAETRAVSRALRFSGALVHQTGREEIVKPSPAIKNTESISEGQKRAIEKIANEHGWNVIQAVRRILANNSIEALDDLNKQEASAVIQRMRTALAA